MSWAGLLIWGGLVCQDDFYPGIYELHQPRSRRGWPCLLRSLYTIFVHNLCIFISKLAWLTDPA